MTSIKLALFDWDGVICDTFPIFLKLYRDSVADISEEDFRKFLNLRRGGGGILPGKLLDYESELGSATIFPDVVPLLADLRARGIPLVLVTTSRRSIIEAVLRNQRLINPFAEIYDASYSLQKPDKRLLSEVLAKYGVTEREAVFAGDELSDVIFVEGTAVHSVFSAYGLLDSNTLSAHLRQHSVGQYTVADSPSDLCRCILELLRRP